MKKFSLILFSILFFTSQLSSQAKIKNVDSLVIIKTQIKSKGINKVLANKYFYYFPKDFKSFEKKFNGNNSQYSNYEEYINIFTKMKKYVTSKIYSSRLINLSLNGIWDADAVSCLQHLILNYCLENNISIISNLNKLTKKERESFWHFLLDSPHPNEKVKNKLLLTYNSPDNKIINEEFKKIKLKWR